MSFVARLLQTILAVVVLATVASLYVAQRQSTAAYTELVDELLRQRTAAFQQEQEARHQRAVEQAAALATSVRLFAALEAGDPEVYKITWDELRLGDFDFFRLLNRRGEVIAPPPDGRAGELDVASLSAPLAPVGMPPEGGAHLGFVAARQQPQRGPADRLYRLLAAPIASFGHHVGMLIIGQRLGGVIDAEQHNPVESLRSMVWLHGELHGGDLESALAAPLARALTADPEVEDAEFATEGDTFRYQRSLLNPGSGYPPAQLVSVFSLAGLEAQQRELAWRIALSGLAAFGLAVLVALALSRQLARPVAELVAATRRIRAGDYAPCLARSSITEMATLAESFNAMAEGLALKDRYHSVLKQVTDPQVAEALLAGRVKLGGELRDVTVMFCDIRQYTALTVGREPEVVIELLNHHMGAMARVVQSHGGVINQFAGDAVMALFGAPRSYGDDAARAVRCARTMIGERARLNAATAVPLQVGIGIASGAMVAGCIGAEDRNDYTVVGARVNLAARLSSSAGAGEVLVDELTRERIDKLFSTEPLPPMRLKGFPEPVRAYRIELDRSAAA